MDIKLISNVSQLCQKKGIDKRKFIKLMASVDVGEKTARKVFCGSTNLNSAIIAKTAMILGVGFGDVVVIAR